VLYDDDCHSLQCLDALTLFNILISCLVLCHVDSCRLTFELVLAATFCIIRFVVQLDRTQAAVTMQLTIRYRSRFSMYNCYRLMLIVSGIPLLFCACKCHAMQCCSCDAMHLKTETLKCFQCNALVMRCGTT